MENVRQAIEDIGLPIEVYIPDLSDMSQLRYAPPAEFDGSQDDRYDISGLRIFVPANSGRDDLKHIKISVTSNISDAKVVFAKIPAGDVRLSLHGEFQRVILATEKNLSINARMFGHSTLVVGQRVSCAGARIVSDRGKILIGAGCLLSDDLLFQAGDQHGIFDLETGEYLNLDVKALTIGRHVWLGRKAVICGRASIGDGSIIATASVVSGDIPAFCAAAGNPAKVIKSGVSWSNQSRQQSDEERVFISELREQFAT